MSGDSTPLRPANVATRRKALAGIGAAAVTAVIAATLSRGRSSASATNTTGLLSLADYGRLGSGNDDAVFKAALADARKRKSAGLWLPPGTYTLVSTLELDLDNFRLAAEGATIQSPMPSDQSLIEVLGNNLSIVGLRTILTAPVTKSHHYSISGHNCLIDQCVMEYSTDQNTPAFYVRGGDGLKLTNSTKRGSNAFIGSMEASDVLIAGNQIYGTAIGDDAIAIKSINRPSQNIRITRNHIYRHSAIVSIGSQIGMRAADDPSHSRYVRHVIVDGNSAEECSRLAFIKPGALKTDYRDGLVEDVVFTDNVLTDDSGVKFQAGFDIRAGHGAIVRNIRGTNNRIRARASGDSSKGRMVGALAIRSSGGGNIATIEDVDLNISYEDPKGGAEHGLMASGYPVENIVRIDPSNLSLSKLTLEIDGNGCSESGVLVLPGGAGDIKFEKLKLSNYNRRNNEKNGGIRTASSVILTDDVGLSGNGRPTISDPGGSFAKGPR